MEKTKGPGESDVQKLIITEKITSKIDAVPLSTQQSFDRMTETRWVNETEYNTLKLERDASSSVVR